MPDEHERGTGTLAGARDHARSQAGEPAASAADGAVARPAGVERRRRAGRLRLGPPAAWCRAAADRSRRRRLRAAAGAQRPSARRTAERRRHREGPVAGLPGHRRPAAVGHGPGADDDRRRHERAPRLPVRVHHSGRRRRRGTARRASATVDRAVGTCWRSGWPSSAWRAATSGRASTCSSRLASKATARLRFDGDGAARDARRSARRARRAGHVGQHPAPARRAPVVHGDPGRVRGVDARRGRRRRGVDARTPTSCGEHRRVPRRGGAMTALVDVVIPARAPWSHVVRRGRDAADRRPRRQPGRGLPAVQRRRSRRALLGGGDDRRPAEHLPRARYAADVRRGRADDDDHARRPARTTTRSAGPAAGNRTRCATATTRVTSTPASTTSSTRGCATG